MKSITQIIFSSTILLCVLFAKPTNSQSLLNSNLYLKNMYILNPAYTGTEEYLLATFQASSFVSEASNAPQYLIFNIQTPLDETFGVGLNVMRNTRGLFETTTIDLSGSYKAQFSNDSYMLFGLSAGYLRDQINQQEIAFNNYTDLTDPTLSSEFYDNTQLRVSTGMVYVNSGLEIGASFPRIIRLDSDLNFDMISYIGYTINADEWQIKPSLLYQVPDGNQNIFEGNLMLEWDQKVWAIFGYRSNGSINTSVGFNLDSFGLGYSYGSATGDLSEIMTGRHEVLIKIMLEKQ